MGQLTAAEGWRVLFATALALGVSGCVSVPAAGVDVANGLACDDARMAAVERDARRTFKEVHWLRCPQAPTPRM